MSWRSWLFGDHPNADKAIAMADEVTRLVRDRRDQRDPLRVIVTDMFFHKHDVALIADAYEISQESRIYRGPEAMGS